MVSWIPSIAYPPAQDGYWSPVTSTLNWCEEVGEPRLRVCCMTLTLNTQDYYATQYSAEIINTLTNLLFIYLAFKGIISCLKHGHDNIFMASFAGYMAVGTGSFLFHSTLKCTMILVTYIHICRFPANTTRTRSYAARGRTLHDLHDVSNVLCNLLLLEVAAIQHSVGNWVDIFICIHHAVLPLPTRSRLPSERLRTSHHSRGVPLYLRDGSEPSSVTTEEENGIRGPQGSANDYSRKRYLTISGSPRSTHPDHNVVDDCLRYFYLSWWVRSMDYRQRVLFDITKLAKNHWTALGHIA